MGILGLFGKKGKEMDIPPPPPPIISSETVPLPIFKEQKPEQNIYFLPPKTPAKNPESAEQIRVNLDDFMPKDKETIFTAGLPEVPGFSRSLHLDLPSELKSVSPEDFGSGFLEDERPLEELHRPEPIVPPSMPKPFTEITPDLKEVEERQIEKAVKKKILDKPLFVNANDYKSVLGALTTIKTKVNDSEKILAELNELKNIKDKTFEKWRTDLEDIQRKLLYIDKTLYEER